MWKTFLLAFLASAIVGTSAVFVGRHEGKINGMTGRHLILGANKCTWGPGYWCKNISTTHECAAIDHCVSKNWNTLELPQDDSDICTFCVQSLTELETVMNATLSQDVVEAFLDKLCDTIFVPEKICDKYLSPYVQEIMVAIAKHIKPQVTCHTMGFCNNEEEPKKMFERLGREMAAADLVAAVQPVIITGNVKAVYGGNKASSDEVSNVAPLDCSDGQVYWCKSMANAKKCNAVEHCKQVVWSHQKKNSPTPLVSEPQDTTASPLTILGSSLLKSYDRVPKDSEVCSQGQTYWCSNITSAASCEAVPHCIQAVWTHMRVEKDTDSVCQICKDMVQQARDQLESNETLNDLKMVLEGSCNLLPVKVIRKTCDRLADDYIPEFVEILASQMNPDVVCSVAGLCGNAQIDKMLLLSAAQDKTTNAAATTGKDEDCTNCAALVDVMKSKFNAASKQQVVSVMHDFCSEFSSLSDICLKVVNNRADLWYSYLNAYLTSEMDTDRHFPFSVMNMCRTNNMCTKQTISKTTPLGISVEVNHKSETGVVSHESTGGDDLPCSLCEQLVVHLKDILIANTTEAEFKEVLEGICKQTGGFSAECLSAVQNNYAKLYNFMTSELKPEVICVGVGLCPKKPTVVFNNMDILAAIPIQIEDSSVMSKLPSHLSHSEEEEEEEQTDKKSVISPVLPQIMIEGTVKPLCVICEYVLHFVQEQVADQKNEAQILTSMKKACNQMPGAFADECNEFIKEYGTAFVALFIQQIDPSQVCPKLKACTLAATAPMMFGDEESEGACPMCLLAVQAVESQILNNRTEENIKHTLDHICSTLPKHLSGDCDRFVNKYYDELIDMLVAETTPQEICVYIKLCMPPKRTTETPKTVEPSSTTQDNQVCILCEFVMQHLDKIIADKDNEEKIKHAVHSVCRIMPKHVKQECDDFVNTYADLIIQLLAQNLSPKEVCDALDLCKAAVPAAKVKIGECAICQEAMSHLDDVQVDISVKKNIYSTPLDKVCYHVSQTEFDECNKFILKYGTKILIIVEDTPSYLICDKIKVCSAGNLHNGFVHMNEQDVSSGEIQHNSAGHAHAHELKHVVVDSIEMISNDGKAERCTTVLGLIVCESQLLFGLMGVLMCMSLVLILVVARVIRRKRSNNNDRVNSPYERLYQPTIIS